MLKLFSVRKNDRLIRNKKRSIFFYLPYWKDFLVHHNLDVMHTEKNVCESLIGTLLNIHGKTNDGENVRLDMVAMGIRESLKLVSEEGKMTFLLAACYTLSRSKKKTVLLHFGLG